MSDASAHDPAAIEARGLFKSFGDVRASDGIELVVPRGACFGLVGQNGAGKTTFIKLMLGIARPDSGVVHVLGGDPEDVRVRSRVGYLPERLELPASYTPLSFLDGVARFKRLPTTTIAGQARDLLALVGLEEGAWTRRIGGFSKGMKQRTGLAAALVGAPDLLVLDEPTDGIDPLGRKQIRDVIADIHRHGTTIFLNSHLLAETERICDHVAILHKGRVHTSGALATLQRKDAWRVQLAPSSSLSADALPACAGTHGFASVTTTSPSTDDPQAPRAFRFQGQDAAALSNALAGVLRDGALVLDVRAEFKDLESLLSDAATAPASPTSEAA